MLNRIADAAQWFKYLATTYPDKMLLDNNTNSLPANLTLDKYAVARVQGDVSDSGGHDRTEGCYRRIARQLLPEHGFGRGCCRRRV